MSDARAHDVIVIGAGPAGSAAAALLAMRGHRVLVLEKDEFPRFHIGESLLPVSIPVLERIGVTPRGDTFVHKKGAIFVSEVGETKRGFCFDDALEGCPNYAWHVERSLFDAVLRDRAAAAGAEVRHGESVEDVQIDDDAARVRVKGRPQPLRARYVLDATGQDRLLARQRGAVVPYKRFGSAAIFTHYEGISDEAVQEIGPGNEIRIILRPEGWGWIIPLPNRRLSVGVVSQRAIGPEGFDAGLLAGPLVQRWTAGSERHETRVIQNFSYRNAQVSGPRFSSIGDAACFLDPVFSSGVALALRGAEGAADALGPALDAGTEAQAGLQDAPQAHMERAYRTFAALIDRFYNSHFAKTVFLAETAGLSMYRGVILVLAGDVWREDNPFQELLLRARHRAGREQ